MFFVYLYPKPQIFVIFKISNVLKTVFFTLSAFILNQWRFIIRQQGSAKKIYTQKKFVARPYLVKIFNAFIYTKGQTDKTASTSTTEIDPNSVATIDDRQLTTSTTKLSTEKDETKQNESV